MTVIYHLGIKEQDGFIHGLFKQAATTPKSLVLSTRKGFLIFKWRVYPVKVSKGLFWKREGPSRITSCEQHGLVQQPLCLVRTLAHFSAFPHPESCMHSCFHPAVVPVPS